MTPLQLALLEVSKDTNALRRETISAILECYDLVSPSPHDILSVEKTFVVQIRNPNTLRTSHSFLQGGKLDVLMKSGDDNWIMEHKTTSDNIETPDAHFYKRLSIDTQISGYMLAAWQQGIEIAGCIYDVIRKPEIAPKRISIKDAGVMTTDFRYLGEEITRGQWAEFAAQEEPRETPSLFRIRLRQDMKSRPQFYFQRRVIRRTKEELAIYAKELWQHCEDIRTSRKKEDIRRNPAACLDYGRPCEYLDACANNDESKLIQIGTLHPELDLNNRKKENKILTHTRLRTFQQCRRKHYYRYERGIRNVETAESLVFGDWLHRGLAKWYEEHQRLQGITKEAAK